MKSPRNCFPPTRSACRRAQEPRAHGSMTGVIRDWLTLRLRYSATIDKAFGHASYCSQSARCRICPAKRRVRDKRGRLHVAHDAIRDHSSQAFASFGSPPHIFRPSELV
jgi:hypothetical protein